MFEKRFSPWHLIWGVLFLPKRFISHLSSSLVRGGVSLIALGESHLEASALVLLDMALQIEAEGARRIQAFMDQQPEWLTPCKRWRMLIANYQPHRPRPRLLDGLAKNVHLGRRWQVSLALLPPGVAPGAIGRRTGSGSTRVRTSSTCQRSWSGAASSTC